MHMSSICSVGSVGSYEFSRLNRFDGFRSTSSVVIQYDLPGMIAC